MPCLVAVCLAISLVALGHHAAQLELAGELAAQLAVGGNEVFAHGDHGFLGRDRAVCLHADKKLGHVRM